MKTCPECNEEIEDDEAIVCWNCGATLEVETEEVESENNDHDNLPVLPDDLHVDTTTAIFRTIADLITFPINALVPDQRMEIAKGGTTWGSLFLILGYQIVVALVLTISLDANPYIPLAGYLCAGGIIIYISILTASSLISFVLQYGCYLLCKGNAHLITHVYLTALASAWFFTTYLVSLVFVVLFRSETLFSVIMIPGSLYFLYLHLLTLADAHEMKAHQIIGAFILTIIVTAPIIWLGLVLIGLMVQSSVLINLLVFVIAIMIILSLTRMLRSREDSFVATSEVNG